jgi:carbonic anhydrase
VTATDDIIEHNAKYASTFERGELPNTPLRQIAIVTCMDCRIEPHAALGLRPGDAHLIRNAGGVVTEQELRALAISQRAMGTTEVVIIRHTDCGVFGFDEAAFASRLEAETGSPPPWIGLAGLTFDHLDDDLRVAVAAVSASPYLQSSSVRGFVYDVETGALREVG